MALIFMHMTVPPGHGVDRMWSGHAHHMAPVIPFFLAATIPGGTEVLVIEHPLAGIQLVKGTVEQGESVNDAAARELSCQKTPSPCVKTSQ